MSFTRASANKKTGPIPVSMTEMNSCPASCALKGAGCYAELGPLAINWRRTAERGMEWEEFCAQISRLPRGQLWRHNQAGDLPGKHDQLDLKALAQLVKANAGRKGFTYTHYPMEDPVNLAAVKHATASGFVVNASADTLEQADALRALGLPVVTLLPSDAGKLTKTPAGHTVVVCPASRMEDVTCATCGLCAVSGRKSIVGFPAHGPRKNVINVNLKRS